MSEKTEPATHKKLEDARKKGQVPQSKDLSSAFSFGFAVAALIATASASEERVRSIVTNALIAINASTDDSVQATLQAAHAMVIDALWIAAPVLGAAVLGALVGGLSHVGFNISFEPLSPKPDKLDPVAGVKRIFSMKALLEAFKSVVQVVFIGTVLYQSVRSLLPILVTSGYGVPGTIGQTAWAMLVRLLLLSTLMFAVLGVVDYVIQKLLFLKQNKMSKDEVKREWREQEGDPQLKGERKALAREIAFSNPRAAVATANAVVVNPTHYAVALRYAPGECGLPFVVAKGMDADAALIREVALAAGVPIIGNPPLARSLYRLGIHATVPEPLLESVAIVLRWAQQLRGEAPA